jgi:hypothetical protein
MTMSVPRQWPRQLPVPAVPGTRRARAGSEALDPDDLLRIARAVAGEQAEHLAQGGGARSAVYQRTVIQAQQRGAHLDTQAARIVAHHIDHLHRPQSAVPAELEAARYAGQREVDTSVPRATRLPAVTLPSPGSSAICMYQASIFVVVQQSQIPCASDTIMNFC